MSKIKKPLVSVVIPAYNREKTIERAVRSVLDQSYDKLELIVVDDCSTDNTAEVVRKIEDSRLRYVCLDTNSGACAARNRGIDEAKGEYIAFQDSDDYWKEDKLRVQLNALIKSGADVCFHKLERVYDDPAREHTFFPGLDKTRFMSHEKMCNKANISTQTILARKDVCDDIRFDEKVKKTQDYDWGIRASIKYTFLYLDKVLAIQYVQDDSISNKSLNVVVETREYFLEKYRDEFESNRQFEKFQLHVIARAKTFLGEDAGGEYKRLFAISHSPKYIVMYILFKMRLMKIIYKVKGFRYKGVN